MIPFLIFSGTNALGDFNLATCPPGDWVVLTVYAEGDYHARFLHGED